MTPSDNSLSVSWSAVGGATGYEVRSSTDGSSWTTEHSNVSGTSVSVANANDAIEYIAVRATNASAASAWTRDLPLAVQRLADHRTIRRLKCIRRA